MGISTYRDREQEGENLSTQEHSKKKVFSRTLQNGFVDIYENFLESSRKNLFFKSERRTYNAGEEKTKCRTKKKTQSNKERCHPSPNNRLL
jgi:hypothetical protein